MATLVLTKVDSSWDLDSERGVQTFFHEIIQYPREIKSSICNSSW